MKQGVVPTQFDLAPPRKWRRLMPGWLRSLIWVDSSSRYDGFLSYSWKCDEKTAAVVHTILQQFLRPWYRVRAKTIFRDLSCLPAGSSLEDQLFDRMDRSTHLILLASPCAAHSWGMEIEARHWFSRERNGEVLVIVTEGECESWNQIREQLLPDGVRKNLAAEPLWIPLQHRRGAILSGPLNPALRGELVEDLKQVLLRLHAPRTWEELHGEERAQRNRVLKAVSIVAIMLLALAVAAVGFARFAQKQRVTAEHNAHESRARELTAYATGSLNEDPERSVLLAMLAVDATLRFGQPPVRSAMEGLHQAITAFHVQGTFPGPAGDAGGMSYSPDGKSFATSSPDGLTIWNVESGEQLLAVHGQSGPVKDIAFNVDGMQVATANADGTATIWDTKNGKGLLTLGTKADGFNRVFFSSNGKYFSAASTPCCSKKVEFWETKSWAKLKSIPFPMYAMGSVAFTPDGKQFAIAPGLGATAEIWDSLGGKPLKEVEDGEDDVPVGRTQSASVNFSHDGRLLATVHYGSAKIWDADTGKQRLVLEGPSLKISSIAFSHDKKMLATGTPDNSVRVWNAENGMEQANLRGSAGYDLAFSPDDGHLVTGNEGGTYRVLDVDVDREELLLRTAKPIGSVAFTHDGNRLVTHNEDDVTIWEGKSGRKLRSLPFYGLIGACYIPGRDQIAVAVANEDEGDWVGIWNAESGNELITLDLQGGNDAVTCSPDGNHIATRDRGVVTLWDGENGKKLLTLPKEDIRAFSYSPNGKRLSTMSQDGVDVWDSENGKRLRTFPVTAPPWDDNGNSAFSPDGTLVVFSGDEGAEVWNIETGKRIFTLRGQKGGDKFNGVAFSPDGKWIATSSASVESIITLWDVQNGKDWLTLHGASGAVLRVVFSPDSKRLATTNDNGAVNVFAIDLGELLTLAKHRVTRELTREECQLYLQSDKCPALP